MPELPEVETIKRIIEPQVLGQSIQSVKINNSQIIAYPDEKQFVSSLCEQKIDKMSRRGKFLIIHFESGDRIVIHLRMTGQILLTPPDFPEEKHTHLILELSGGNQLRYIDVRRFGRFWFLKTCESDDITGICKLGVEPLDENLTSAYLKEKLKKSKKAIKGMLLDQSVVAGIGNIYSDEILFESGIYPEEKCFNLNDSDWHMLSQKIGEIITWGIDENRMTSEEYLAGNGNEYSNMASLRVYGRAGQLCRTCNSVIERIIIGGRSSCYCPNCQRRK